jgi:hypothetical protein
MYDDTSAILNFIFLRTLVGHLPLEEILNRSWSCIKQPDTDEIERQIEECKFYYAQEDD